MSGLSAFGSDLNGRRLRPGQQLMIAIRVLQSQQREESFPKPMIATIFLLPNRVFARRLGNRISLGTGWLLVGEPVKRKESQFGGATTHDENANRVCMWRNLA